MLLEILQDLIEWSDITSRVIVFLAFLTNSKQRSMSEPLELHSSVFRMQSCIFTFSHMAPCVQSVGMVIHRHGDTDIYVQ